MRPNRVLLAVSSAVAMVAPAAYGAACGSARPRECTVAQAPHVATPFGLDLPSSQMPGELRFVDAEAISAPTRKAIASAMPAIQRKADAAGFHLQEPGWRYEQVLCPVLSQDVLLLYTRDHGAADRSALSVAFPRDGQSPVRLVPVLRRSFIPYGPAAESALTIAVFNQLREAEPSLGKPDWLLTGLCYAALAGAHVRLTPSSQDGAAKVQPGRVPMLQVEQGKSVVRFVDVEEPRDPKQWTLSFDDKGRLVQVEVSPITLLQERKVP